MAIAIATFKAVWLCHLLYDLWQDETLKIATIIHCDNQSTLTLVHTTKFDFNIKHIANCYHFINQNVNTQKNNKNIYYSQQDLYSLYPSFLSSNKIV